ncbi:Splicing factor 3B subunit [Entamoeba marina]
MGTYGGMPQIKNLEATVHCGDLDNQVTEQLLYELMIQAGPVVSVNIPRDRVSGQHKGIGYVEYRTERDAEYALKIFSDNVTFYGKQVKFNRTNQVKKTVDVGANLFVNNLDASIDENALSEIFRNFGMLVAPPKIVNEGRTGKSFAFISYDSFEASDRAIAAMDKQYLGNKQVSVEYAYRNKHGERFGNYAERLLASKLKP